MECEEKRYFKTKQQAKVFKIFISSKLNKKYRIYKCPKCNYWHLTSQLRRNHLKEELQCIT